MIGSKSILFVPIRPSRKNPEDDEVQKWGDELG